MVERNDPTMEEIVIALRETRHGAGRPPPPPLSVVRGRDVSDWTSHAAPSNENRGVGRGLVGAAGADNRIASDDVANLRYAEIERLLADNARCNERIMFLLNVIEREQARNAAAGTVAVEMDRAAILRDVKASLDAELRPILLVLQRLLEKQQLRPAEKSVRSPGLKTPCRAAPVEPSGWIADIGREVDSRGEALELKTPPMPVVVMHSPNLRQRMARAFHALRVWFRSERPSSPRLDRKTNDI